MINNKIYDDMFIFYHLSINNTKGSLTLLSPYYFVCEDNDNGTCVHTLDGTMIRVKWC